MTDTGKDGPIIHNREHDNPYFAGFEEDVVRMRREQTAMRYLIWLAWHEKAGQSLWPRAPEHLHWTKDGFPDTWLPSPTPDAMPSRDQ